MLCSGAQVLGFDTVGKQLLYSGVEHLTGSEQEQVLHTVEEQMLCSEAQVLGSDTVGKQLLYSGVEHLTGSEQEQVLRTVEEQVLWSDTVEKQVVYSGVEHLATPHMLEPVAVKVKVQLMLAVPGLS
jgi:hypothetical protein